MDTAEQKLIAHTRRKLEQVSVHGAPGAVFEALAPCVPIVGGLVGSIGPSAGAAISSVVKLPPSIVEGWVGTPEAVLVRMLSPLENARPGTLISDTQAITGPFRDQLELLARLRAAGLGEAAGYKLSTRAGGTSGTVHHFLTFALDEQQKFTGRHRRLLAGLQPSIQAALDRIRVPLISSERILAQIVEERETGYLCATLDRRVVELNRRAHTLIVRHLAAARIDGGRGMLERFVARALEQTTNGPWRVDREVTSGIEIQTYRLAKETHAIHEDLYLFMICEVAPLPARMSLDSVGLTTRQIQSAHLLCSSDLSYKQCADRLGISEGTMRKHAQNVYRRLRVHSRLELMARFR